MAFKFFEQFGHVMGMGMGYPPVKETSQQIIVHLPRKPGRWMLVAIIPLQDQGLARAFPVDQMVAPVRGAKTPLLAADFPAGGVAAFVDVAI